MNKIYLVFFLILLKFSGFSQDTLTLEQCQKLARENYPLIKQQDLLSKISDLRVDNISTGYYPQFNVSGQVSWQSDVTQLPIQLPGVQIPEVDKDVYKVFLDINQVIYDGGLISGQKKVEESGLKLEEKNLEVELNKIKDRINLLFFGVLMYQENEKIIGSTIEDIKSKLKKIEAGVKYGTTLESNALVLKVEIMKLEAQLLEIKSSKTAALEMLKVYTSKDFSQSCFVLPDSLPEKYQYVNRAELEVFSLQKEKLAYSKELVSVKLMPKLSAYSQLGYGKPGLNMLASDFADYYIFGARLSWTPYNWKNSSRERQIFDIQMEVVNSQKEIFEQACLANNQKYLSEINKYEGIISLDTAMISLREKIVKTSASQLENGIITSTEYLAELNALSTARLNLEYHKILLAKAKVDLLTNNGDL